jgi:excisionase family DNA binding protein
VTEGLLTLDDVAQLLKVSKRTVFRLLDQGEIQGLQIGGKGKGRPWRFEPMEISTYLEQQRSRREQENSPA